jgi:hypothetical protein
MRQTVKGPQRVMMGVVAIVAGLVGGVTLSATLLAAVSYWIGGRGRLLQIFGSGPGPGLHTIEMIVVIIGLAGGFAAGLAVWSILSVRLGWLTWEEVEAILRGSDG